MRRTTIAAIVLAVACAFAAPAMAHQGDPRFDSVLTGAGIAGPEGSGPQRRRPAAAPEPHRPDGDAGGLRERAVRAAAARRHGAGQPALARDVPEQRSVRERDRAQERRTRRPRPSGRRIEGDDRYETHDHRIHWMSPGTVPQKVTDQDVRTKVFDWSVPVQVGDAKPTAITGTLWWRGKDAAGGMPVGAIAGPGRARARVDRVRRDRAPAPGARRAGARGGLVSGGARLVVAARARRDGARRAGARRRRARDARAEPPGAGRRAGDAAEGGGALLRRAGRGGVRRAARVRRQGEPGDDRCAAQTRGIEARGRAPEARGRPLHRDVPGRLRGRAPGVGRPDVPGRRDRRRAAERRDAPAGDIRRSACSRAALGIARGLGYLAIAIALGGVAFLAFCWRPAVRGESALAPAGAAFEARLARLVGAGVVLGIVAGAAAVVLQAAVAGETSAWTALDPSVVREVLGTRTGLWLGIRFVAVARAGRGAGRAVGAAVARLRSACRGARGRHRRGPGARRATRRRRARSPCSRPWTSCTWRPPPCGSAGS